MPQKLPKNQLFFLIIFRLRKVGFGDTSIFFFRSETSFSDFERTVGHFNNFEYFHRKEAGVQGAAAPWHQNKKYNKMKRGSRGRQPPGTKILKKRSGEARQR